MIWRSSFNSRMAQLADFMTVFSGFIMSYFLWSMLNLVFSPTIPQPKPLDWSHFLLFALLGLIYVALFYAHKAYNFQRFTSLATEYTIVLRVSVFGILLALAASFFLNFISLRRTFFILSFFVIFILLLLSKSLLFYIANQLRKVGRNRKRVLLVGTGTRTKQFIETVHNHFDWGLDIIGLLTGDNEKIGQKFYGYNVIGCYDQVQEIVKTFNPEEVIITISTRRFDKIRDLLEICEKTGIQVRLHSDFFGRLAKNVRVDQIWGLNIISFDYVKQSEFELFCKRALDLWVSVLLLIILFPLFLVIAIAIYMQNGRPLLYRWHVVGKNRKSINSWKFRTMVKNADELKEKLMTGNEMSSPMFKMTDDPRILPIGHLLRKYSLDELPQLFSVFKGDLSLVGPRPPLQTEFRDFDLWHRRKLTVKPGLTCLWQISGRNGINSFDEWAKMDLEYIDNWSLWLDFKILLKTIPVVLKGTGV